MIQAAQERPWAVTSKKVEETLRRIVDVAHPSRVIVFGSYARGESTENSDLDIWVVKPKVQNRYSEIKCITKALRGLMLAVDLLLIDEDELKQWAEVPGSVYRTAIREGKVIYEAA